MTLKAGDKVRLVQDVHRYRKGDGFELVGPGAGYDWTVKDDRGLHYALNDDEVEKIEEPTPKFKVGDKVRRTGGTTVQTVTAVRPNRYDSQRADNPFLIALDGDQRYRFERWFEKVGESTFKMGDRVRTRHLGKTAIGTIVDGPWDEYGGPDDYRVRISDPERRNAHHVSRVPDELEKVESVPFKLERGDKVVNRKTGRKGKVCVGLYGRLWVGDVKGSFAEANMVPASALEEYEEHHPGTYDLIKKDAPW